MLGDSDDGGRRGARGRAAAPPRWLLIVMIAKLVKGICSNAKLIRLSQITRNVKIFQASVDLVHRIVTSAKYQAQLTPTSITIVTHDCNIPSSKRKLYYFHNILRRYHHGHYLEGQIESRLVRVKNCKMCSANIARN